MDDEKIIDLFFARSEEAISQTKQKYSCYCESISQRILRNSEDVEECLNDTWMNTWNAIPPQRPNCFRVFLGTIIRNLSLNKLRNKKTEQELLSLSDELQVSLSSKCTNDTDKLTITECLNTFLADLPKQ